MRRLIAAAGLAAVASVPLAQPAPAVADPLCYSVEKDGTFGPPFSTLPLCVPYGGPTNCQELEAGLSPELIVRLLFCVPR